MKQKKMVLALLLALILLLGVAYLLYMKFGASMAPQSAVHAGKPGLGQCRQRGGYRRRGGRADSGPGFHGL